MTSSHCLCQAYAEYGLTAYCNYKIKGMSSLPAFFPSVHGKEKARTYAFSSCIHDYFGVGHI
jgi:hypothetical protein